MDMILEGRVKPKDDIAQVVHLKPINVQRIKVTIEGISPLLPHNWDEKSRRMMREKGAGKKTKNRDMRNPEKEATDALYLTADRKPGVPLLALKSSIIDAAHKDIGIEKTLVRKAFFIKPYDISLVLPMDCSKPVLREDTVRVGMGSADLRYRYQFDQWAVTFVVEYDADLLQPADIMNLIDRAGFGLGICDWRPERGGEFGRFRVRRG